MKAPEPTPQQRDRLFARTIVRNAVGERLPDDKVRVLVEHHDRLCRRAGNMGAGIASTILVQAANTIRNGLLGEAVELVQTNEGTTWKRLGVALEVER